MKKIKILALVLVLAFAAMGGAYAIWEDDLFAMETITTGKVEIEWRNVTMSDGGANYMYFVTDLSQPNGAGPRVYQGDRDANDTGNANEEKNIARKHAHIVDNGLVMSLQNAYPGYQEYVMVELHNTGTVPVKLSLKDYDFGNMNVDNSIIAFTENEVSEEKWLLLDFTFSLKYYDQAGCLTLDELEGFQLDPQDHIVIKINQRVTTYAPQSTDAGVPPAYLIGLGINAIQWNAFDFDIADEINDQQ